MLTFDITVLVRDAVALLIGYLPTQLLGHKMQFPVILILIELDVR